MLYSVIAICTAKNDGKDETFERVIAQFDDPYHAQDFIEKCLPTENRDRFYIKAKKICG